MEDTIAKGQVRPNKEKKKPKAEHNKKSCSGALRISAIAWR